MGLNFNDYTDYSVVFNGIASDPVIYIEESLGRKRATNTTHELHKFFEKAHTIDSRSKEQLSGFLDVFEKRVVQHIQRTHSWIGKLIIAFQRFTSLGTLGSIETSRAKLKKLLVDERVERVVLPRIHPAIPEKVPIVLNGALVAPVPKTPDQKPAFSRYFNVELASAVIMMRSDSRQAAVSFAKNEMLPEERSIAIERLKEYASTGKISERAYAAFRDFYACIEALTIRDFFAFDESTSLLSKSDFNLLKRLIQHDLSHLNTTLKEFSSFMEIVELLKADKEDEALELTCKKGKNIHSLEKALAYLEERGRYPHFRAVVASFLPALKIVHSERLFQMWDTFRESFSKMPFSDIKELFAKLQVLVSDDADAAETCQNMVAHIEMIEAFAQLILEKDAAKIHEFIQAQAVDDLHALIEYMMNNREQVPALHQVEVWRRMIELSESDQQTCYDQKVFARLSEDEDTRNEQIQRLLANQEFAHEQQKLVIMRLRERVAAMTESTYHEFLAQLIPSNKALREKYDLLIRYDVNQSHLQKGVVQVVIGPPQATKEELSCEITKSAVKLDELRSAFIEAHFTDEELELRFGSDFTEAGARDQLREQIERETRTEIQKKRADKKLKPLASNRLDMECHRLLPKKKMDEEIQRRMLAYFRRGYILEAIDELIKNLQEKTRIALMPSGAAGIQWCLEMELGLIKILEKLKDAPKETVKECLSDIICSVGHCAVGIEEAIIRRYREQVMQLAPTPDEDIYQDLAGYRAILCESVLSPPGDESVMFYAKLGIRLGKEFGLPGYERFKQSQAGRFSTGGAVDTIRERHRFQGVYSAPAIVEFLAPQIEGIKARKEYCYATVPQNWKRPVGMDFEQLRALIKQWIAAKVPPEKIVKDLQDDKYDLWIQKMDLRNIDAVIDQARKNEYMASITNGDKLTQAGIINMLQNMQVLTPVVHFKSG